MALIQPLAYEYCLESNLKGQDKLFLLQSTLPEQLVGVRISTATSVGNQEATDVVRPVFQVGGEFGIQNRSGSDGLVVAKD